MAGVLIAIEPYRLSRFTAFLDPCGPRLHSGYQATQAVIAVASGQVFGVGLGDSVQKFGYLPKQQHRHDQRHHRRGARPHRHHPARRPATCCWPGPVCASPAPARSRSASTWRPASPARGRCRRCSTWPPSLGLLPILGIPLPLVSLGGSSLVAVLAGIGILLNISTNRRSFIVASPATALACWWRRGERAAIWRPRWRSLRSSRARGATVGFVTTPSQLARLEGLYPAEALEMRGFERRLLARQNAVTLRKLAAAAPRAWRVIRRFAPDCVVGGGGYVSGPVVALAGLRRIPAVALEADAHLGVTNRLLRPYVRRIFLSFPIAGLEPPKYVLTGPAAAAAAAGGGPRAGAARVRAHPRVAGGRWSSAAARARRASTAPAWRRSPTATSRSR